jgi:hypothetical protein
METIRTGDVLISHKGNYHYLVESVSGNEARILWLERMYGEPLEFYTYHRSVDIYVALSYYDVLPAGRVEHSKYHTPKNGWPKG